MNFKSQKGDGGATLIVILAVAALAYLAPKPSFLDSRSREADKSAKVSAEVERRVAAELEAAQKLADARLKAEHDKSAAVSASVHQIGIAAGQLQDSPQSIFIRRETNFIGPWMQPPDPVKLLESERRRVAYLEGRLDAADKLYAQASKEQTDALTKTAKEIADLAARAVKAEAKLEQAFSSRRQVDSQLQESAAYQRGQQAVIGFLVVIAVLLAAGWIWSKINGFTPTTLGKMIADIRTGEAAEVVFDRYVPERLHRKVRHAASDAKEKA